MDDTLFHPKLESTIQHNDSEINDNSNSLVLFYILFEYFRKKFYNVV